MSMAGAPVCGTAWGLFACVLGLPPRALMAAPSPVATPSAAPVVLATIEHEIANGWEWPATYSATIFTDGTVQCVRHVWEKRRTPAKTQRAAALAMFEYGEVPAALDAATR